MSTIDEVMSLAWQQHQAGNLQPAEMLYRQVLGADSNCLDALHLLGMICQVTGRVPEAVALYQQYLRLRPTGSDVLNNLGVAYATLGRLDEALACYRQAVLVKPDYAEAHNNLGYLQGVRGDWEQALNSCQRALAIRPQYAEALRNLGIAHFQLGQLDEAERCLREALALQPNSAEAYNNLGNVLLQQNKVAEAGDSYREALRLQPDFARAYNNLGAVYRKQEKWDDAIASLQKSVALAANDVAAQRNLANLYKDLGRHAEALPAYERVLELTPSDDEVRLVVEALRGDSTLTRVPAAFVASYYDALAEGFERDVAIPRNYRSPQLLREALEPAPPPRSLDILDLGCGTGLPGAQFRDWAKSLVGVDLSAEMLARARQRGIYDELVVGDLVAYLQGKHQQFDLVVASDVLLYLGDLAPVMRVAHQALRPGGRFAFTAETVEGQDYRFLPVLNFGHSREYLARVAAEAGLHAVSVREIVMPTGVNQGVPGVAVVLARPAG
jgi:predicted TPR repeat methyltransferase